MQLVEYPRTPGLTADSWRFTSQSELAPPHFVATANTFLHSHMCLAHIELPPCDRPLTQSHPRRHLACGLESVPDSPASPFPWLVLRCPCGHLARAPIHDLSPPLWLVVAQDVAGHFASLFLSDCTPANAAVLGLALETLIAPALGTPARRRTRSHAFTPFPALCALELSPWICLHAPCSPCACHTSVSSRLLHRVPWAYILFCLSPHRHRHAITTLGRTLVLICTRSAQLDSRMPESICTRGAHGVATPHPDFQRKLRRTFIAEHEEV